MLEYKVLPFIITNYDEISVIQNAVNTVIINDAEMIEFFNKIDFNSEHKLSYDNLCETFKDKKDNAIEFLINNLLIQKVKTKIIEYEKVVIISNDEVFINSMKFNSNGHYEKIICEILPDDLRKFKINNINNMYIIFLNPFNLKYYIELVNIIKEKNVLSRFAFYYNNRIFISNYYKKEWYNPCPLCFFGNIESSLRGRGRALNTISFEKHLIVAYS